VRRRVVAVEHVRAHAVAAVHLRHHCLRQQPQQLHGCLHVCREATLLQLLVALGLAVLRRERVTTAHDGTRQQAAAADDAPVGTGANGH
jgi:hypothetical protein